MPDAGVGLLEICAITDVLLSPCSVFTPLAEEGTGSSVGREQIEQGLSQFAFQAILLRQGTIRRGHSWAHRAGVGVTAQEFGFPDSRGGSRNDAESKARLLQLQGNQGVTLLNV